MTRKVVSRRAAIVVASTWWLAQPPVEAAFYVEELRRGAFPPEANSIGIPIFQHAIGWLAFTPLVALVLVLAFRRAPRRIRLAAFDRARPAWCGAWSIALLALSASQLAFAVTSIARHHPLDVAHALLGVVAALVVRAGLCEMRGVAEPPAHGASHLHLTRSR